MGIRIEHVAIWTRDIERLKNFYVEYFNGTAGAKYTNMEKEFQSYFISFESGARLEVMQIPRLLDNSNDQVEQYVGLSHIAFFVGSVNRVNQLTETLKIAGYRVISEPRFTGDGYYESCVLDPDGNRIEITE